LLGLYLSACRCTNFTYSARLTTAPLGAEHLAQAFEVKPSGTPAHRDAPRGTVHEVNLKFTPYFKHRSSFSRLDVGRPRCSGALGGTCEIYNRLCKSPFARHPLSIDGLAGNMDDSAAQLVSASLRRMTRRPFTECIWWPNAPPSSRSFMFGYT
jgi:hypothetical protein